MSTTGTITVCHVRDNVPNKIYIGRAMPHLGISGSPLGNPYKVLDHGERAMDLYREWLAYEKDRAPGNVFDELARIYSKVATGKDVALACWCKTAKKPDAPCHGDVIKEVIERMLKEGGR